MDFLSIDGGQSQTTGVQIEAHNGAATSVFAGTIADAGAPFRYTVPFAAFSDPAVFSHVTSLTLRINPSGATDVDFVLDQVGVPEPGTLVFLGLGLALLGWRKREVRGDGRTVRETGGSAGPPVCMRPGRPRNKAEPR